MDYEGHCLILVHYRIVEGFDLIVNLLDIFLVALESGTYLLGPVEPILVRALSAGASHSGVVQHQLVELFPVPVPKCPHFVQKIGQKQGYDFLRPGVLLVACEGFEQLPEHILLNFGLLIG